MRAAVYKKKGLLEIENVPEPQIGPEDVLIRVSHCAICGSDTHRFKYGMLSPGSILGHEYSGKIVDKGGEVEDFQIGDRVTLCGGKIVPGKDVYSLPPRYTAKEKGFYAEKNGAYAEFKVVHNQRIMKIPQSVSNLQASLTEPLAVALHTLRLSKMRLGDSALVIGSGPIGLLTQQCASLSGAGRLYISETNAVRRNVALSLGATEVFDPSAVNLVGEIVNRTEIGVDVVFECAGAAPTLQEALEAVCVSGRVLIVSLAWEPVHCLPVDWVGREVEMKAVYGTLRSEWPIALGLLADKKIQTDPLITHVIPLEDIQSAFQEILKPDTEWVQAVVAF